MKAILTWLAVSAVLAQTSAPPENVNLSALAAQVVDAAAQARRAILLKDQDGALRNTARALELAEKLRDAAVAAGMGPPETVSIPLYTDLKSQTVSAPPRTGRHERVLSRQANRESDVRQITTSQAGATLEVAAAIERLTRARAALERGDLAGGDAALAAFEREAVVAKPPLPDSPLLRARQNLELARTRVAQGKFEDARATLEAAAQALDGYAKVHSGPRQMAVDDLRRDIRQYATRIVGDHAEAARRIGDWFATVDGWYQAMAR